LLKLDIRTKKQGTSEMIKVGLMKLPM